LPKKKLLYKLIVFAIIPVLLSMAIFGAISYTLFKQELIHERIEEATSLIVLSSDELRNPLYFLELNRLNDIIINLKKNPNVLSVYILDQNGRVITDGTHENKFFNQILSDDFSKNAIKSDEILVEIHSDVLKISSPITIKEKIGTISIDFSLKILDQVLMDMITILIAIGALIFIIIATVEISISHSIIKPIIELRNAAHEIAKGNFGTKLKISSDDEIGELAVAFNTMGDELQKSNDDRKKYEENIKKSLNEKEVLLREIHHRVKNNMQIISSLLRLQSHNMKDKTYSRLFEESQNRITSMALVHEKLYQSKDLDKIDFNAYIRDMVTGLFQSYGISTDRIKLIFDIGDVSLRINSAIPCGLVINELVTNSLKYAFPDGRKGEIKIQVYEIDNEIEVIMSDNGIGIPEDIDFRNTGTLGLKLVSILAERQLRGTINLNRKTGTEFRIRFKEDKK
jgi:two-component sensor histidine kinase/HAMP domain-containing protein